MTRGDPGVTQAAFIEKRDPDSTASECEREWTRVLGQIKAEIGDDAFRNWLRPMNLQRVDGGQAVIAAPTRFLRDWVTTHYADRLLALWRAENQRVTNLSIVVAVAPERNGLDHSAASGGESKNRAGSPPLFAEPPVVLEISEDRAQFSALDQRFTFENFIVRS